MMNEPHAHEVSVLVEGLTVQYDHIPALKDVTFQLRRGERVAVVGPNGAGKSTLFKVIAGALRPTAGRVSLFGGAVTEHTCVAYVPQRSQIDLTFPVNVREAVMMGRIGQLGPLRWPSGADWRLVAECLALVDGAALAERHISELSGGQLQRVFIARALAQEAQIMLMDEPLTGLDIQSQENIFTLLDELSRRQVTVLIATHDLHHALERFERVILLKERLVSIGLPHEVITPSLLQQAYGGTLFRGGPHA
jgi:ABC-type Mn2+/Zn2+ transport system ATPase subunit